MQYCIMQSYMIGFSSLMETRLLDRERELAALNQAARARGGQLVMVWGRRRTGKTYLLQAFSEHQRTVYYTATQQSAPVELMAFTDAVRAVLGTEGLPAGYGFPDWSTALNFVTDNTKNKRLVVVLDEFPYLAESTTGLESVVQRWWDQRGRTSRIVLVLCGSAVAYMAQIAGAAAPLHQRMTARIYVAPLDYRSAGLFVPELPAAERAVVYGILGGTPLYLDMWDPEAPLRENLFRLFGDPASPLVDAAELVLSGELPEREGYFRILQAVALGRTRPGEINDYAKVAVERPLRRLTALGLLERRVPALDDPSRTKRAIYRIADPYFAFWFRFIASNRPQIARGLGRQVVNSLILPGIDDHMGSTFEEMAREHARRLVAAGDLKAERVESWWRVNGQHEVDLVGVSRRDTITFVGTVKWSARRLGRDVLQNLDGHAVALPGYKPGETPRLIYGRAGCEPTSAGALGVRYFSVLDLYQ
jgi:AAA+ ATPase superfamily predicted ATPase